MRISVPFNAQVPKEVRANLKWRAIVHRRVLTDPEYADTLRDACSRDPLFFINGFTWTYDPRRTPFPKLPFILYPYQEEAILEILQAIGSYDLLIEKSRDMGASWLCVIAPFWCWKFKSGQSFLFASRVDDYVDKTGNPKSLFWKFDYILNNLPTWLKPQGFNRNEHRTKSHIENPENGSVIDGESTTDNLARGDRRTAILLDEFAAVDQGHRVLSATRDATKCRLFNSTPSGTNNAFFDIKQTGIKKLRLHWSTHPLKAAGLYTTADNGGVKLLDKEGFPIGYIPVLDNKLRSPWYDTECSRAANLQEIAQEIDIDYLGSAFQYFNAAIVNEKMRRYARQPFLVGDLEYDETTGDPIRFRESPDGRLRLWCLLNKESKPSIDHKVVLGNDVSAGTGASNSCIAGWDMSLQEKVCEYVNPHIRPEAMAKQAVALARWFGGAFLIWESGGPGRQFGSRVMELGYSNVYLRKNDESISGKVSDIPGVAMTKETKLVIMGAYRAALEKGECINRSKEAVEETLEYVFSPDGGVVHSRASSKTDPSGAKANHGDRVIADALAIKGMSERVQKTTREEPVIPPGCLKWRMEQRRLAKQPSNRELTKEWSR